MYTIDYYLAINRNVLVIHATKQLSLNAKCKEPDTKDHILYDSIYEMSRIGKSIRHRLVIV